MACPSVWRLQRAPLLKGVRASSSASLARSDHSQQRAALLQRTPVEANVLSNGIRVVTQRRTDVATTSVGLFRKGGSEQETRSTNGISGFFQRIQQRGTKNLAGAKLGAKIASLGGRVHSVNERQYNGTLLSAPKENIGESIAIVADMASNPAVTKENVEAERSSSLAALNAAQYDIEQVILDYMHDVAFQGTTLAMSPLGNTDGINSITPESLQEFALNSSVGGNLCLAVVGDVDHAQVMDAAEKHLQGIRSGNGFEFLPIRYTGAEVLANDDDIRKVYSGVGFEAPAYGNADSLALEAIRHICGHYDRSFGHDARHCLTRAAFDSHNYDYNIHAYTLKTFGCYYATVGLWGNYHVCNHGSYEPTVSYVTKEWHRLRNRCRDSDAERAKCSMKVEMALKAERPSDQVELMGKQLMTLGRVVPLHEMDQRIDNLSAPYLRAVMDEYFYDTDPCRAALGRTDTEVTYQVLRKLMWMSEVPDT